MSGMYTQPPTPGASGKFANLEKLPSPRSGYGRREFPDLWSAPIQGIVLESSQLSSISQLRRSHPVTPLCLQIALAQSWDCANVLRNPKIAQTSCAVSRLAVQSRDWHAILDSENAQRSLEIDQIPRLHNYIRKLSIDY